MARAKLPKELIKKYGISKKAWAVFRGRNAGKKVRKIRRATRKGRPKASRRPVVRNMARRRRYSRKRGGGRKHGMPSAATIAVTIIALRELGILDMLLNSMGADRNIVNEVQTWAQNFQAGSMVDAAIPAVVLMFARKFIGPGPRLVGNWRLW